MITPTVGVAQLVVRDLARSRDWYRDVLGLELLNEDDSGDGRYATFHAGGLLFVLLEAGEGMAQEPPEGRVVAFNLHFQVEEDLRAIFDALVEAGADVVEDWTVSASFETFYVHDPDGHRIEISRARTADGARRVAEATGPGRGDDPS